MTYGKLSSGKIILAPPELRYLNKPVINPDGKFLEAQGWKPVIFVQPPQVSSGYHLVESWTETTECITQVWTVTADSP